jgi:hypothetical protein
MWLICIKIRGLLHIIFYNGIGGNLDICLGVTLAYFIIAKLGNYQKK